MTHNATENSPACIQARYPRASSVIGSIAFGGMSYFLFDGMFLQFLVHSMMQGQRPLVFVFFLMMLFGFAICFKTVLKPSVLFYADVDGVMLGKGVFVNTFITLPWDQVKSIKISKMRNVGDRSRSSGQSSSMPAVLLTFKQKSGMSGQAEFSHAHSTNSGWGFIVAQSVLGMSADDAVNAMHHMAGESGVDVPIQGMARDIQDDLFTIDKGWEEDM